MAGDGVNDAAAIRRADVGIGVTSRGSTSARGAADLILTGSDTLPILDALVEGRALWSRVRDAVSILVGGNAGEVAFTLLGTAVTGRAPLSARQLLLVNTLTDMLPALAVALSPARGARNGENPLITAAPVGPFLAPGTGPGAGHPGQRDRPGRDGGLAGGPDDRPAPAGEHHGPGHAGPHPAWPDAGWSLTGQVGSTGVFAPPILPASLLLP
jgi:hypothetical protein